MGLTVDQQIQIWNAVGTWVAGMAGFGAVVTSLYLATRTSRVRLRTSATIWATYGGTGKTDESVVIDVTNIGERPVTITGVGWRAGGWRRRKYGSQTLGYNSDLLPMELAHGQSAAYRVSLGQAPYWASELHSKLLGHTSLRSLRATVTTSVGTMVLIKPSEAILAPLKK